eukprot:m.497426 g.497426  ORF g.497426 m.497426 type:complete len:66 (+) comp51090_c0_seq1:801-998(+)
MVPATVLSLVAMMLLALMLVVMSNHTAVPPLGLGWAWSLVQRDVLEGACCRFCQDLPPSTQKLQY